MARALLPLLLVPAALAAPANATSAERDAPNKEASSTDTWWADYAANARQVPIGHGRSLNLLCQGSGSPTLIFESGLSDSMTVWRKVQPVLAQRHRVCAYDRAGLGESPPGPLPRDAHAVVSDLDKLIAKARLRPPYVLVGHSFGGLTMRLFAKRHPRRTFGLVLVDPPVEGEFERFEKIEPGSVARVKRHYEKFRQCVSTPRPNVLEQCRVSVPDDAPPALAARLRAAKERNVFAAMLAEFDSFGAALAQVQGAGTDLGSVPLIVLTSEQWLSKDRPVQNRAAAQKLWSTMHKEVAAHSRRGIDRLVLGTSHYIQLDRPDAVIGAVRDVIAAGEH